MTRSYAIADLLPFVTHQLKQQADELHNARRRAKILAWIEGPTTLSDELKKLNIIPDPIHEFAARHGLHSSVTHSHYEEISDYEFFKRKCRIDRDVRRAVGTLFGGEFELTRCPPQPSGPGLLANRHAYAIVDDRDGYADENDFIFDLEAPGTWTTGPRSENFFREAYGPESRFADSRYATYAELTLDHTRQEIFTLEDVGRIVNAIPARSGTEPPEQVAAIDRSIARILYRFKQALGEDPNLAQDLFIELMIVVKKGWGEPVLAALSQLIEGDWAVVFNHPTLPLTVAQVFAHALSLKPRMDVFGRLDDTKPLAWNLLVAAARSHLIAAPNVIANNDEINAIKAVLYHTLTGQEGGIHPAYRLIALAALGTLSARPDALGAPDIASLTHFLRNYESPSEDEIKALLTKGQHDKTTRLKQLRQTHTLDPHAQQSALETAPAAPLPGDYDTNGVLTYWLMDYNHRIVERAFFVMSAIAAPKDVSTALLDLLCRERNDDPPGEKASAYVEYYKVVEALGCLGRLYRKIAWINLAFNLHQNNQIGREIERNPETIATMLAELGVEGTDLAASWDNNEKLLSQNFACLQLARWFLHTDSAVADWQGYTDEQRRAALNEDFNNASPRNTATNPEGTKLGSFVKDNASDLIAIVNGELAGKPVHAHLSSQTFQRWMNWQHFGPFVVKPEQTMKLALAADLKRKAWSWEFFELRHEEFVGNDDLLLQLLTGFEDNPFAYLRIDLVSKSLTSENPQVRAAALKVLHKLDLPKDWLQTKLAATATDTSEQVRQGSRRALRCALDRAPKPVPYPSEKTRGLDNPPKFQERHATVANLKDWEHRRLHIQTPRDRAPHAYIEDLDAMAHHYGEATMEEMVRLLEYESKLAPGNHKFRYIAERHDVISIFVDAVVSDKMLKDLFINSFLHAGSASNGVINYFLTLYLRRWGKVHQTTLVELLREYHLTYDGGDPLEHLAKVGHKFVRDKYIRAALKSATEQGLDPLSEMAAYLELKENERKAVEDRIRRFDELAAREPTAVDEILQLTAGLDAAAFRAQMDDDLQLILEERRFWIDNMVSLL